MCRYRRRRDLDRADDQFIASTRALESFSFERARRGADRDEVDRARVEFADEGVVPNPGPSASR